MKLKLLISAFLLSLCFGTTSCVITRHPRKPPHHKAPPPGHIKKIHGEKPAKAFAPGHKKHKHD